MTNLWLFLVSVVVFFGISVLFGLFDLDRKTDIRVYAKHIMLIALLCIPFNIGGNVFTVLGSAKSDGNIFSLVSLHQDAGKNAFAGFFAGNQNAGNDAVVLIGIAGNQNAENNAGVFIGIAGNQNAGKDAFVEFGIAGNQQAGNDAGVFIGIAGNQNAGKDAFVEFGIAGNQQAGNDAVVTIGIAGNQNAGNTAIVTIGIAGNQNAPNIYGIGLSVRREVVGEEPKYFVLSATLPPKKLVN